MTDTAREGSWVERRIGRKLEEGFSRWYSGEMQLLANAKVYICDAKMSKAAEDIIPFNMLVCNNMLSLS